MERAQQSRGRDEESSTDSAQRDKTPGRERNDVGNAAPGSGGAQRGSGGGGGAGAWEANPELMTAMGLGGGSGGGDHALDGITQPPKGKVSGPVSPDVSKQLNDKKQMIAQLGGGASPPGGAASGGGAPGGAAKDSSAAPGGGGPIGAADAKTGAGGGGGGTTRAGGAPSHQAPASSEAAKSPSAGERGNTTAAHGDGAGSVEAMIEELEHGHDSGARVRAAEALGKVKSPKAKPALERAAHDRDPAVAAAAAKALKHLA